MNAKIIKFPKRRKPTKKAGDLIVGGQLIQFPAHALPTLTQRIRQDVCQF